MQAKIAQKKPTQPPVSRRKNKSKSSVRQTQTLKPIHIKASAEKCFWVNDGKILSDLPELANALKTMNKDVFAHHVTKERNDFAVWVELVLEDDICAKALSKARTAKGAHTIIAKHLKTFSI